MQPFWPLHTTTVKHSENQWWAGSTGFHTFSFFNRVLAKDLIKILVQFWRFQNNPSINLIAAIRVRIQSYFHLWSKEEGIVACCFLLAVGVFGVFWYISIFLPVSYSPPPSKNSCLLLTEELANTMPSDNLSCFFSAQASYAASTVLKSLQAWKIWYTTHHADSKEIIYLWKYLLGGKSGSNCSPGWGTGTWGGTGLYRAK